MSFPRTWRLAGLRDGNEISSLHEISSGETTVWFPSTIRFIICTVQHEVLKLFDESVTPLCSPRLLEGPDKLLSPDDLSLHVLLHDDSMAFDPNAPSWVTWLHATDTTGVDASRGPHFNQPDHALQAAIDGTSVVLGWRYLAADDIGAGRLVQPFSLAFPLGSAFYLVYPEAYEDRPKVVTFRDSLV